MNKQIFEKIGMTKGEVRIYFALIELGSSTTGGIIKKSRITNSKVYQILERLEQKGLVSHVMKNNVKHFQVADPRRLLDYMDEKKKEIEEETVEIQETIPKLISMRNQSTELQETTIYQDFRGFQTSLQEFILDFKKGDEYLVFGSKDVLEEKYKTHLRNFYMKKEKKGVKTKLLYNSSYKSIKELYKDFKNTNVKFIDQILPSTIAVGNNKTLIITYGKNPRQVLIKSSQVCDSFKDFFESMWRIAKKW
jgi:HTH-type transcriptional regulator, sugar sensing transcriptional regulator